MPERFFRVVWLMPLLLSTTCEAGNNTGNRPPSAKESSTGQQAGELTQTARKPAVAGTFYPAAPSKLKSMIHRFLSCAPEMDTAEPVCLISPHAGYAYSGKCAACGYSLLRGKEFSRVILMGPSHYGSFKGAALTTHSAYKTPLGTVPVDREAVSALTGKPLFSFKPDLDRREHSIEVQIPFLQEVLGDFSLLPVMVGEVSGKQFRQIAKALLPFAKGNSLIIASSDFTHFGSRFGFTPFKRNIRDRIQELDFGAIKFIVAGEGKKFTSYTQRTGATICGRKPIRLLLELLKLKYAEEKPPAELLSYRTSSDIMGVRADRYIIRTGSVSYAGIAFFEPKTGKRDKTMQPLDLLPPDKPLPEETRRKLLSLARSTIERHLEAEEKGGAGRRPDPGKYVDPAQIPPEAKFRAGAFVTLHEGGKLRGCIGTIHPQEAIWEAVVTNAINAATRDYRFPPVKKKDLKNIHLEISVLTPPVEISGPEEFEVGKHGIILQKGGRRAVFLPQVAPEQGWDRETTLSHLAVKAGLPAEAWQSETRFWVFEAQVFGEEENP